MSLKFVFEIHTVSHAGQKFTANEIYVRSARENQFRSLPAVTLPDFSTHKNVQPAICSQKVAKMEKYSTFYSKKPIPKKKFYQPYETGAIIANLKICTSPNNVQLQVSLLDDTASRGVKNLFYETKSLKAAMDEFTSDLTKSHKF